MKKIFTLSLSFIFAIFSFAQTQLTNSGFESWTNGIPDGWSTTKSIDSNTNLETEDTLNAYTGHAAIKIVTGHGGNITADSLSGFVHYGPVYYNYNRDIETVDNFNVYFPCSPDSVRFAYKYTSVAGDQGSINVYFRDRVIDGYPLSATSTYQVLTLPLVAPYGYNPGDSMSLTFFSSYNVTTHSYHAGSTLWVDDVSFVYIAAPTCVSGVNIISANTPMNIYPNPANGQLMLTVMNSEIGSQVQLYDRIGREVYSGTLDQTDYAISTARIESGYYILRVTRDGIMTHSSSVAIVH
jgi:hypothetical protein